jgi:outer membrane receptor for ferrienterochelin and colicins
VEEVIVTSSRNPRLLKSTPEVLNVVTSKDIEQLNVSSTGEILEYLTGVNIESGTGSGYPQRSIVSLDGFPANYTLVMVDGIRLLTEHIHTGQNIDVVPYENIDRIEVIKGASSAQYGSDAMGGIVNIITKKATENTEASISFSAGSYRTYLTTVSVRTPLNEKVSISTFSNYERSSGIPILSPSHRIGNMGYNKFTTMNKLCWDITGNSSLSSSLYYSQNSMEFRGDDLHGAMLLSSTDYTYKMSNSISAIGRLKYSHWDAEQSGEKHDEINPEIYLTWNANKNNSITAGADFRYTKFTRSAVLEHTMNGLGAFLQDEIELDRFSLLMAIRIDKVDDIRPVITPKIAAMFRANERLRVRASFGRGFHAPSVMELYEEGYGHGGRAYRFGNPDLQPEFSLTSTFSIEYEPVKGLQMLAHAYYNTITNMITPVYSGIWEENPDTSTVIDKWVRTNIHDAKIYGIETTLRYRLDDILVLEAGYNYSDNQNTTTGGQLPYYPGESFFSKIVYTQKLSSRVSLSSFVSLRATKNRSAWDWKPAGNEDYDNPEGLIIELNDYQLLNSGIKVILDNKMDLYLNVSNILGQNIQKLDDSLTEIDGEPIWRVGCLINF